MGEPATAPDTDGASGGQQPGLHEAAVSDEALATAVPLNQLDPHDHHGLAGADHRQDIELKKTYANWLLIFMAAQLVVSDAVFVTAAWAGADWHVDETTLRIWLAATTIELIGVALVVTRYLFPRRDRSG